MEKVFVFGGECDQIELPPGFRFHPTDQELIMNYLSCKVVDEKFGAIAIGEVDFNKVEPWDLPWRAKMGEKEWYFFFVKDRKYPTGLRTNRATEAGYWKATGKDKEIFAENKLVGMKKTLVFYKGRAPRGEKTNWVMHEYRLDRKNSLQNLPKTTQDEWAICRVFLKTYGGKKVHISRLALARRGNDSRSSNLPPLLDFSSSSDDQARNQIDDWTRVPCFSEQIQDQKVQLDPRFMSPSENLLNANAALMQDDSSFLKLLSDNRSSGKQITNEDTKISTYSLSNNEFLRPYEDQELDINSIGSMDLDFLLNIDI